MVQIGTHATALFLETSLLNMDLNLHAMRVGIYLFFVEFIQPLVACLYNFLVLQGFRLAAKELHILRWSYILVHACISIESSSGSLENTV